MALTIETIKENLNKFEKAKTFKEKFENIKSEIDGLENELHITIYRKVFNKCVSKTIVNDKPYTDKENNSNNSKYALLKDSFGLLGTYRASSQYFSFLKQQLLKNEKEVKDFIINNVSKRKKDKIAVFLNSIGKLIRMENDNNVIIDKDIDKTITIHDGYRREYCSKFLLTQKHIENIKLSDGGDLEMIDVNSLKFKLMNINDFDSFIFYEQFYDVVVEMCKEMVTKLENVRDNYTEELNKLKTTLSPYFVVEAI